MITHLLILPNEVIIEQISLLNNVTNHYALFEVDLIKCSLYLDTQTMLQCFVKRKGIQISLL